jgi:ribose 5-phosphate isomerase A
VTRLGQTGPIPVEFIPFAQGLVARRLAALGARLTLRQNPDAGTPQISENGNLIFDCTFDGMLGDGRAARACEAAILAIAGVVDTGLFLSTADSVLVGRDDGSVEVLKREGA